MMMRLLAGHALTARVLASLVLMNGQLLGLLQFLTSSCCRHLTVLLEILLGKLGLVEYSTAIWPSLIRAVWHWTSCQC